MRKIPLLGLTLSLLLVAVLMVAALPAMVQAKAVEMQTWGDVTLDGLPAEIGTTIEVFIGTESEASGTEITDRVEGGYGSMKVASDDSNFGEPLTYKVNGNIATAVKVMRPCDTVAYPVFGLCNQEVNLVAWSTIPPQVTTVGTGDLSDTSATLKGTLDDMGECAGEVKVWFEYDGFSTTKQAMPATGPFSASVSGLSPEMEYTFKAMAETVEPCDMATAAGTPQSFTTLEEPAWPQTRTLNDGWNVISTPVWLDDDSDRTEDILSDWDLAYRWTGSKFSKLSKSYKWEPLQAFYIKVTGSAIATFAPSQEMMAPNDRKLSSNKWALIGPSPIDGTGALTVDEVLAGLQGNYANVIIPGGGYCTSANDCMLSLPAFGGAWVFVGAEKSRTIVGLYGDMTP